MNQYPIVVQILTVLLYFPTIAAIVCFFYWRSIMEGWKKVAFSIVPTMLIAFTVLRIVIQLDWLDLNAYPELLVVASILYVANVYLMVALLCLGTYAVRKEEIKREKELFLRREANDAVPTSKMLERIDRKATAMQGMFDNFVKQRHI